MDVSLLAEQRRNGHMLLSRVGAHEVSLSATEEGPFQLRLPAGIEAHNIRVLGPSPSFLFTLLAVLGPMARPVIQGTVVDADFAALVAGRLLENISFLRPPVVAFVFAAAFFLFWTV